MFPHIRHEAIHRPTDWAGSYFSTAESCFFSDGDSVGSVLPLMQQPPVQPSQPTSAYRHGDAVPAVSDRIHAELPNAEQAGEHADESPLVGLPATGSATTSTLPQIWAAGDRPFSETTTPLAQQAWYHYQQGRLLDALQGFEGQLLDCQRHHDVAGINEMLIHIGRVTTEMGHEAKAAIVLQQALDLAIANQLVPLQGRCLYEFGYAARRAGLPRKAIQYFRQAASIFAEVNDDQSAGHVLTELGQVYGKLGRHDRMHQLCAIAADILRETDDLLGEATALFHCGRAAYRRQAYADASARLEQASAIQLAAGDVQAEAKTRAWLGHSYREQGMYRHAMCCYWDAWTLCQELGDRHGTLTNLVHLAQVYEQDDMMLSALDAYHQVVELLQDLWSGALVNPVLLNVAQVLERTGEIEQALDCYRQIVFDSDLQLDEPDPNNDLSSDLSNNPDENVAAISADEPQEL